MSEKFTNGYISRLKTKDKHYEVRDSGYKGLLIRVQPNGRKYFYYEYEQPPDVFGNRKRARHRIGLAEGAFTVEVAREAATKISAQHIKGEDPAGKRKPLKSSSFKSFLDNSYRSYLQTHLRHGDYAYTTLVKAFADFHDLALVEITAAVINDWKTKQLQKINPKTKKPLKPNTINRQLSDLKACLHRARDFYDLPVSDKLTKVKPCKIDNSPNVKYLKPEEEIRLRQALDTREEELKAGLLIYSPRIDLTNRTFADHLKPAVLVSLNTGLRKGELLKLKWDNVNFDPQRAHLTIVGETSKTGKTRHIPLNEEALGVLKAWKEQPGTKSIQGFVFAGPNGEPLHDLKTSWGGILKRAKITEFRWHDLRHTFASKLVMAGVDLNTVRELMGHADIKMTLRYAHLAPEHKQAAVEKLTPSKSLGNG